jgi:FkbM family methyltransferase
LGANSAIRKTVKKILSPVFSSGSYKYIQAAAKAWDIRGGADAEPEIDLVKIGLREGETALDIGANFGFYAYELSRAVGQSGKVYAFEPVPFTCETLVLVGRLLGFRHNVEIVNKGCSNENGTIKFTVPIQDSGALSTGQTYIAERDDDHQGKEEQVRWKSTRDIEAEVVRLDDFLPEIKELPLIKADIEGAELLAFRGAEKIIDKHLPTVICEINLWFLEGFRIGLEELTGFFFEKGYKLYFYTAGADGKKYLRETAPGEIGEDNYVFLHPSRAERFSGLIK